MQFIANFFSTILAKITAVAQWILAVIGNVFLDLWAMLTDAVLWIFDQVFALVLLILNSFDFSAIQGALANFGTLPADMVNTLGLIGVGYALGIVASAIVIRILLQLIPFVRLGS